MAQADVSVSVRGLGEVRSTISTKRARVRDMRPAFRIVADNLEGHVKQVFRTQGGAAGDRWQVLAESTQRARRHGWGYYRKARGGDARFRGPALVWSGDLRASFTDGHPKHIRRIRRQELEYGSRDERATFHAEGAGRLPKRDPLAFRSKDQVRTLVLEPITLWLRGFGTTRIRAASAVRSGLLFDPTL